MAAPAENHRRPITDVEQTQNGLTRITSRYQDSRDRVFSTFKETTFEEALHGGVLYNNLNGMKLKSKVCEFVHVEQVSFNLFRNVESERESSDLSSSVVKRMVEVAQYPLFGMFYSSNKDETLLLENGFLIGQFKRNPVPMSANEVVRFAYYDKTR